GPTPESPVPETDEPARAANEADDAPVLATACATCRGLCCDQGGTTAMLAAVDIARWHRRDPDAAPEAAISAYLDALPAEAVAGSCVYLGAEGCALPRAMRADWCNRVQCRERATLQAELAGAADRPAVMVARDPGGQRPRAVGGWSAGAGPVHVALAPAGAEGGDPPGEAE